MNKIFIIRFLTFIAASAIITGSGTGFTKNRQSKTELLLHPGLTTITLPESVNIGGTEVGTIAVDIYIPEKTADFTGDILVLPGWNFSRKKWQNQSAILSEACNKRFRCVFPEMKTTLYESRYFPETTRKWAATPGGEWIRIILIPALQRHGLFKSGGRNFVMGLSTGGRGSVLVPLQNPGLFKAAAALSGDFDQTAMPRDRLMTSVYGPYKNFPQRWATVDNPQNSATLWNIPLYLGHGEKDSVVPFSQSKNFFDVLKKKHPDMTIVFHDPDKAGHDFAYWSSEVNPVMEFFLSVP